MGELWVCTEKFLVFLEILHFDLCCFLCLENFKYYVKWIIQKSSSVVSIYLVDWGSTCQEGDTS